MRTLTEALANVTAGYSAQSDITARAALMIGHAKAGNMHRAEEYAAEIEALQRAVLRTPGVMPAWAASKWQISHLAWGAMLAHGWLAGRGVWAAPGWTAENVAAEAHRCHPLRTFTIHDVMRPQGLMHGVAA